MKYNKLLYIFIGLLIVYIFPFSSILMYFVFYNFYKKNNFYERAYNIWLKNILFLNFIKKDIVYDRLEKSIFNLCFNKINIPPVDFDEINLFTNSKKLIISLINDINLSSKNIYIIFYIWEPGFLSDEVAISLINASYRGVKCRIILDSIGSINFFKTMWPKIMNKAGIKIVESFKFNFFKIFLSRVDLRQHKKIVLIDNYIIYLGSMNLVDPNFFKDYMGIGKWVDLMVKIKGLLLMQIMKVIFFYDWELETGNNIYKEHEYENFYSKLNNLNIKRKNKKSLVQVLTSGPGLPNNLIHRSLLNIIFSTKERLIITTPYFIPSNFLIDAICTVADKGIDVSIIIPSNNDSFLVYWASRYFLSDLLLSNVKIYFFKSNFLHTKSILVDYNLSLVGTINFDMRSIWLNFEIGLIIDDVYLNKKLFEVQRKYISKSELINYSVWKNRSLFNKIFEKLFCFFNPLL